MTMVSVIIPAHNEEAVIARCLAALTRGARPGELDVIVVANGCADHTADVARDLGVRVIETPVAGKTEALRLGDAECTGFPRLYLDADVDLTAGDVRTLAETLTAGDLLACSPVPRLDLAGVSPVARRFHEVHERLTEGRRGLAGAGAYMLTEQGHRRVFPMPDVLADDGWTHRGFAADERAAIGDVRSVVRPARTVPAVIRRRALVRLGNEQLAALGRPAPEGDLRPAELVTLVRKREVSLISAGCFAGVLLADRVVANWRRLRGGGLTWSADSTSRTENR